jgi:hypothetical protein
VFFSEKIGILKQINPFKIRSFLVFCSYLTTNYQYISTQQKNNIQCESYQSYQEFEFVFEFQTEVAKIKN